MFNYQICSKLPAIKITITMLSFMFGVGCGGYITDNFEEDYSDRTYEYFVPDDFDETIPMPLIFVFHGAFSTGSSMRQVTQFDMYAQEHKFIVVYPNSTSEQWYIDYNEDIIYSFGDSYSDPSSLKDVKFVDYLIEKFKADYNIDSNRIYACGFSHGACFTNLLSVVRSNTFAAVAQVEGGPEEGWQEWNFSNIREIPITFIFAEGDWICWDELSSDRCTNYTIPQYIRLRAQLNGCNNNPISFYLPDIGEDLMAEWIRVLRQSYISYNSSNEVTVYRVMGGGHEWFMFDEFNTTETIIEFFLKHAR